LLKKPIVPLKDGKIAVMRRIGGRWHLYGVGKIRA
jgi:translation initiation factor 2 gamma subunit (eIF-2gamma)